MGWRAISLSLPALIRAGRVFIKEPVHLGGLIGECVEIVRPQAEEEQIPIETDVDPSVSTVPGDRDHLKQVILNLLTNAIKYNKPGGRIRIQLRREGDQVLASVSDSGKGIPAESLPHIFERFYRVPDQESRVGGTGLGLAISKRITEAHQGTLSVESLPGQGTTLPSPCPPVVPWSTTHGLRLISRAFRTASQEYRPRDGSRSVSREDRS